MYNVLTMKGFTVAEARARFSDLLDQAERGETVVIERHGVRFSLKPDVPERPGRSAPFFEWVDPAVLSGEWTWTSAKKGLTFRPRRSRKAR
jgi:hypothetical protein